jgi:hypothetical protein
MWQIAKYFEEAGLLIIWKKPVNDVIFNAPSTPSLVLLGFAVRSAILQVGMWW